MNTPEEMILVCQAIRDGKAIQYYSVNKWLDSKNALPNFATWDYRVKPTPKPDVVRFMSVANGYGTKEHFGGENLRLTFDGETCVLKSAEVLK